MSIWRLLHGRWGTGEDETDDVRIDASTNSLQTVDYAHHEVHAGSSYILRSFVDLSINNVADFRITTANTTKWIHMIIGFTTEAETESILYEGAVISVAGTAATPRNRNRNHNAGSPDQSTLTVDFISNTSLSLANDDTDVTGAVTLVDAMTGSGKEGGTTRGTNEFILKQNTIYCGRFIAESAGWISFDLEWYEHTDKH